MPGTTRAVWGVALVVLAPTLLFAAQIETHAPDRPAEIEAKCWFNAQPVRIHDAPRLILLEFWSLRSHESREFGDSLSKLYLAYREAGSFLIVALTKDECEEVRGFIHREKIEYKVGAESRSGDDYGIKELPAVLLVDPKAPRIVARWSGREVKVKAVVTAIQDFLGPPPGVMLAGGALSGAERESYWGRVAETGDQLAGITSEILALPGEIPPQALSALDRFYEANLPEDPAVDNAMTRAQGVARERIMESKGEAGYAKLFASGRLSEAAKTAIRDRALHIAKDDPSPSVRMGAAYALRAYIGRPGDAALLEALRGLYEGETDALVKAHLDHALENLGPNGAAKRQEEVSRPTTPDLRRMVNESPDPASSAWADAHAYRQTVSQRTTEQLLEDYRAFPDPPDDEIARQNATLKRQAALGEVNNRLVRGEVRDVRSVKDHLSRILSEEPDPSLRKWAIYDGLKPIAERGGSALRGEIVDLFEKRLPDEPDRYVRAILEYALGELKGK